MATDLENLVTAKSSIISQITTLSASLSTSGGMTSYSMDGQSVSRLAIEDRLSRLYERLRELNLLIQEEEAPIEIITYGV